MSTPLTWSLFPSLNRFQWVGHTLFRLLNFVLEKVKLQVSKGGT